MAKKTITPRDIEGLSAYLDDRLTPDQRTRLENRLRQEPGLRSEYEALRRTRLMLRTLSRVRAPRNFTLTPAMAGIGYPSQRRVNFGWVSAVAMAMLVIILIGDFLVIPEFIGVFPLRSSSASKEVALEPEALSAPEKAAPEAELTFPTEQPGAALAPTLTEEQPAAKAFSAEPAAPTPEATPSTTADVPAMADALPETETEAITALESGGALPEETPAEAEMRMMKEPPATPLVTETQDQGEAFALQAAPAEATELATPQEELPPEMNPSESGARMPVLWTQVVFWSLELALTAIALGAGAYEIYSRIRS